MRNKNKLVSALPPLKPVSVIDTSTGEYLTRDEYETTIKSLLHYVTNTTQSLYQEHTEQLLHDLGSFTGSANSYGRQKGYRIDYMTLPVGVKAKSRIQELVLHKLISETASYVLNPTLNKQAPSFAHKINLGAVNDQMARVYRELNSSTLYLEWKCWDRELLLEFNIPNYVLSREIIKWSLPVVQITKQGELVFYYSTQEQIPTRTGTHFAGVDVGVIEPYTAVVLNQQGARIAVYHTSKRLQQLTRKKTRLIKERGSIKAKINRKASYGSETSNLTLHQDYLSAKITRLEKDISSKAGNELITKLDKHSVSILNMEQLNWVSGTSKSKVGSNHSFQHARLQESITHAGARVGIHTRKVRAHNTSQDCHKCGNKITHHTGKRLVVCSQCVMVLDRDINAAINIAHKNNKLFPHVNGYMGRSTSRANPALNGNDPVSLQSLVKQELRTPT